MMQLKQKQTHKQKEKGFFLNTARHTIIGFTVFLLTIFALGSCVVQMPSGTDMMRFNLTQGGSQVDMDSPLNYNTVYRLTVEPGNDVAIKTADYNIVYQPADAVTIVSQGPDFIEFTLNDVGHKTITITVTHKNENAITKTVNLHLLVVVKTAFQKDIEDATTVPDLSTLGELAREVLKPLGAASGATLVKIFATEAGTGNQDGSSWENAWAATNLRAGINTINDASANKVYLVMVAGGTYKPTYANPGNRGDSFGMKNRVAIMGGFQTGGGWARTGTTIFSGDIGTVGDNTDNSYNVFNHHSLTLNNAHLYGVTIAGGNTTGGSSEGGMYNYNSSPVLTSVVLSNNSAGFGGGMYNNFNSSPILNNTVFVGNTSTANGGGMYNQNFSSPVLNNTVFVDNRAPTSYGGGVYNSMSSPVLIRVVFISNRASAGGGMYNVSASPVIIGAVFKGNTALDGGGMFNDNNGQAGPLIVNTIFSGNTTSRSGGPSGPDIGVHRSAATGAETIRIAGSVLGIGLPAPNQPTNAIVGINGTQPLNISNYSLANGAVNFGADATFTVNGMNFPYPTITGGSSANNLGLYARKHVNAGTTTYYFSETGTGTSWYTGFTSAGGLDGTAEDLPTTGTIEDLTATDLAGNTRSGRPDAGVHELP